MKMKSATPVPSLNNDSPSITAVTFLDSPSLLRIPVAAIGSVGETIDPSKKHRVNPILIPSSVVTPQKSKPYIAEAMTVVNSASSDIGLKL